MNTSAQQDWQSSIVNERPRYDLSSYGTEKFEGSVIFNDYSPEELRLEFMLSGGNVGNILYGAIIIKI